MADDDSRITKAAKGRASFKLHAAAYVFANLFLAFLWLFTADTDSVKGEFYWPVVAHVLWGIGLAVHGYVTVGPGAGMLAQEEQAIRDGLAKP